MDYRQHFNRGAKIPLVPNIVPNIEPRSTIPKIPRELIEWLKEVFRPRFYNPEYSNWEEAIVDYGASTVITKLEAEFNRQNNIE